MKVAAMDDRPEDIAVNLSVSLKKDAEDESTIHYSGDGLTGNLLLAGGLALKRSALPEPPPVHITATLRWELHTPIAQTAPATPGPARVVTPWPAAVKPGDLLTVIKSQSSGVKSPPEWLDQYVGRTGRVLWTTPDGAMLDLDGKASWFSFQELQPET
jgi:hypothetical protein